MRTYVAGFHTRTPPVGASMSRADASVIVAVMVVGSAAGFLVDSVFWAATPLVAGLLAIASPARRRVTTEAQAFLPEFPDALRKVVSETADARVGMPRSYLGRNDWSGELTWGTPRKSTRPPRPGELQLRRTAMVGLKTSAGSSGR